MIRTNSFLNGFRKVYFLELRSPKKNKTNDIVNMQKDWENVGRDIRESVSKFREKQYGN